MTDKELLLEVKNITKSFPGVRALSNVSLSVHRGEVVGLVGENGAGKSTLMNTLLGSLKPDSGEMIYKGKAYTPKSPADALNHGISMIHQELTLAPDLTVATNIWLGQEKKFSHAGYVSEREKQKATKELLSNFNIDLDCNATVRTLSVAEMQLTELARALSSNSDIIIMDEPTSSFTSKEVDILLNIVRSLKARGIGMIFISHKLDEVFAICDTVTVLRDGQHIKTYPIESVNHDQLISMMVGREVNNLYPKREVAIGEGVFEVKGLSRKGFFHDISFTAHKGEIPGFGGLIGAGRSEIMECIFGIEHPDCGEIWLNGKKLSIRRVNDATSAGIAMVTEDRLRRGLIHKDTVEFNMSLAYLKKITKTGFVNRAKRAEDVSSMAKQMRLKYTGRNQLAGTLSGGNQQKVIIGKWLLNMPDVLILDEPTRGIDVGAKSEIYNLIGDLAEQGKVILLISSELPELMGLSDRIIVISGGEQKATIDRKDFNSDDIMKYAFNQHE